LHASVRAPGSPRRCWSSLGFRLHRVAQLKVADLTLRAGLIHVNLGSEPLVLPDQLSPLAAAALDDRSAARMFAAGEDTEWLFPGTRAGHPLSVDALTERVAILGISATAARRTALASLAMQLPPVIIARLTGLNISSASRWSEAVSASNAKYAALSVQARSRRM
jgi:integrase